jgi:hypothetical protein
MPNPAKDKLGKFRLTAVADTPDLRDWVYEPALVQLKREIDPPDTLNILNQGGEGSCTGFALAAVINLLRHRGHRDGFVSPRMLYEMAKQHDEWPGFDYEGRSRAGTTWACAWIRNGNTRKTNRGTLLLRQPRMRATTPSAPTIGSAPEFRTSTPH